MSKIKIVIWVVIIGWIVTLFLQNDTLFLSKQALSFDLYFIKKLQTPELPVAAYFLAALIIGLVVAYIFGLSDRFKARRIIKTLTTNLDSQRQEIVTLKKEIEEFKNAAPATPTGAASVALAPEASAVTHADPEIAAKVEPSPPSIESDAEEKNKDETEKNESNKEEVKH